MSFGDAFLLAAAMPPELRRAAFYLGHADYFQGTVKGVLARAMATIPVDAGRQLTRALQLGAAGLRLGRVLVIFPEGERTFNGRQRGFKPGTALLVRHTGVPVVPVAINGAFEAWGRDRSFPRRGQVKITFGEPIDFRPTFTDDSNADRERITRTLEKTIAAMSGDDRLDDRPSTAAAAPSPVTSAVV